MRTSAILVQKTSNFFKLMVCPYGQEEGLSQGGQFFAILCRRLLWTAPFPLLSCRYEAKPTSPPQLLSS